MAVPQKELAPWGKVSGGLAHDSGYTTAPVRTANLEEIRILSGLKEQVASGDHGLDVMLAAIADAARRLTGASGTALAMWKNGAMVCRARSGITAPPIGAQLSADTGISGECLRTGKRQHCSDTENDHLVDVEVCRSLGLRSIAVLPVQGWRAVNGILEAFATSPGAFSEHHLALLEELAALAERARALRPSGALPTIAKPPAEKSEPTGLLPASDRIRDLILTFVGRQSRPLVLGAVVVATMLLFGFAIWLGWRGPSEGDGKAHAAAPSSSITSTRLTEGAMVGARFPDSSLPSAQLTNRHLPDNDPVWKPHPGGESLLPSGAKPSAGVPTTTKGLGVDKKQSSGERALLVPDEGSAAKPRHTTETAVGTDSKPQAAPQEQAFAVEPSSISAGQGNSALDGILSAKALLPELSAPVSQGVTGGKLMRRVAPVYPAQAKTLRLEGKVVLSAMVTEDGSVANLKVVSGQPTLAQAATDAVKQWRYQPFLLNGKAVKRETTITLDFKLP